MQIAPMSQYLSRYVAIPCYQLIADLLWALTLFLFIHRTCQSSVASFLFKNTGTNVFTAQLRLFHTNFINNIFTWKIVIRSAWWFKHFFQPRDETGPEIAKSVFAVFIVCLPAPSPAFSTAHGFHFPPSTATVNSNLWWALFRFEGYSQKPTQQACFYVQGQANKRYLHSFETGMQKGEHFTW